MLRKSIMQSASNRRAVVSQAQQQSLYLPCWNNAHCDVHNAACCVCWHCCCRDAVNLMGQSAWQEMQERSAQQGSTLPAVLPHAQR